MTVSEYIKNAPENRQAALNRIRSICKKNLPGFEETIEYGMPAYKRNGVMGVAFASQKNNIALYILKKPVMDKYRVNFAKSNIGKGCIRYHNPEKIDFELIEKMIAESYHSSDGIC